MLREISRSVTKVDHAAKMGGSAVYAGDWPDAGMLHGRLVRSPHARARIIDVRPPELPEGYFTVGSRDVRGVNRVHIVQDDCPVFADGVVEYVGDPVLMVVGPDRDEAARLASGTVVTYEELPAVLDVLESRTVFFDYGFGHGDVDGAFATADKVYTETFETGYQEQGYLETQGIIALYENGRMTVRGSLQCPYYVHGAVANALGMERGDVRVVQDTTGGGFGGKEAYPSILACQVAVAAMRANGRPVRVIFDRREDMEFTSKRHPSRSVYKIAVKGGVVTAMDIDVIFDSGAFTTLSPVVLQRGIIAASGVYNVPNLRVRGRAMKTNTVPTGAFRGFGAPQTFFAVEMAMSHIARDMGAEPLAFKEKHVVKQGDKTSTGGRYHFPVPLKDMVETVDRMSGYRDKRRANKSQTGRYRKGIGLSMWFHGAGFTGSGERDFIKAVTRLHKYPDGRVEVLASNSDIGQGIKTTFCKIVANELGRPLCNVIIENPDTDRTPDSGPTVASRSLMIVGELLRRAAARLREEWRDGEDQSVEERFEEPNFMIPFHLDTFQGDAYPTYAWGVCAVEVQVDALTGVNEVLGAWGSFDVGTPIDLNIVTGQMEGGLLQGLGYSSMEQMAVDSRGRIRNNSYSDYIMPTSMDVPELQVNLHVEEYPLGPYGGKGAGELPLVGVPGAYLEAMEQALGACNLNRIPFGAEDAMRVLREAEER